MACVGCHAIIVMVRCVVASFHGCAVVATLTLGLHLLQFDDQGLVNTDPRTIALPDGFFNSMPTDIHGITFNRTPKMVCS